MNAVSYTVSSKHLTSKIVHELLFSIAKRQFIKPAVSDKYDGKLIYKLLPGNYLKFSLFILKKSDYAKFEIVHVHIDKSGNIDEKIIYEIEVAFDILRNIVNDINAPYALAEFVKMMPGYHHTAYVSVNENYQMAEDAMTMVESIKRYLENKVISQ
jgi:hypothetical protein